MAHPINPAVFHSFGKRDRDVITAFFDQHEDLDINKTSIVQVVSGGLKVTEFVRDENGKTLMNHRGEALTEEKVVSCTFPYEVYRILHDMSERAAIQ